MVLFNPLISYILFTTRTAVKSSMNFTLTHRRYTFLYNGDIFPTDWCSMETVPSLEKKVDKMKTTDWCSTEVVVPSDGENLVVIGLLDEV